MINLWKQSRDILLVVRSAVDKIWKILHTLCEQVAEMGDLTPPTETQEQNENEDYPDEDDDNCDKISDRLHVIVRFLQLPDNKRKKKAVHTVISLTPIASSSTLTPFQMIAGMRTIYRGINYESKSLAFNAAEITSDGRKHIFHKGHKPGDKNHFHVASHELFVDNQGNFVTNHFT